jgi:hypothetical protein
VKRTPAIRIEQTEGFQKKTLDDVIAKMSQAAVTEDAPKDAEPSKERRGLFKKKSSSKTDKDAAAAPAAGGASKAPEIGAPQWKRFGDVADEVAAEDTFDDDKKKKSSSSSKDKDKKKKGVLGLFGGGSKASRREYGDSAQTSASSTSTSSSSSSNAPAETRAQALRVVGDQVCIRTCSCIR